MNIISFILLWFSQSSHYYLASHVEDRHILMTVYVAQFLAPLRVEQEGLPGQN